MRAFAALTLAWLLAAPAEVAILHLLPAPGAPAPGAHFRPAPCPRPRWFPAPDRGGNNGPRATDSERRGPGRPPCLAPTAYSM